MLLRLPTLLKGRAWAIFDALSGTDTDTYKHLKKALLDRLSPATGEDRLSACDKLSQRKLHEDWASPCRPAEMCDTELQFHFISALPEKIAFQMKLLPKLDSYHKTISKARVVLQIYCRAASAGASINQIQADLGEGWVDRLEEALLGVSQQLAALSTRP